jgi:hypothetical protein
VSRRTHAWHHTVLGKSPTLGNDMARDRNDKPLMERRGGTQGENNIWSLLRNI